MSDKKIILKEIKKKKKNSHKTQSKWERQKHKASGAMRTIWDKEFWRAASENFSKTGRLFALTRRRGELNQNEEISTPDGERQ